MARRRKKTRTHAKPNETETAAQNKVPRSFVLHSGKNMTPDAQLLIKDLMKVMKPNTADKLKQRRNNKLKDFVKVAGQLGVSHMMILSRTVKGTNLRIAKLARGPTLTFRIAEFSLMRDLKPNRMPTDLDFTTAPLLVLNNFDSTKKHVKLMSVLIQNMFPAIKVQTMRLADVHRVVLFHMNASDETIEFRHYLVHVKKVLCGSKSVRKVLRTRGDLDISSFKDIGDFILNSGYNSETDVEEDVLPANEDDDVSSKYEKRAIRLHEIGPRLKLKLLKIQEGFCDGPVIFHSYLKKTKKEEKETEDRKRSEKKLKEERKKKQEENVERKKSEKEEKKRKRQELSKEDEEEEQQDMEEYDDSDEDEFDADEVQDDDQEEDEEENEE